MNAGEKNRKSVHLWKLISEKMTFLSFGKQHLVYNSENVICDLSMQTIIFGWENSYRLHMS